MDDKAKQALTFEEWWERHGESKSNKSHDVAKYWAERGYNANKPHKIEDIKHLENKMTEERARAILSGVGYVCHGNGALTTTSNEYDIWRPGNDWINIDGAREGAGRKPIDPRYKKIPQNLRLQQWIVDELDAMDNKTVAIEQAVIKTYKLKRPE